MIYKNSIHFFFKLSGKSFPHITTKEYNLILNVFNIISSIYDKHVPKGRKSFLNYSFVLKRVLIMMGTKLLLCFETSVNNDGEVKYSKYIPPLKTHSKQKELE